MVEIKKILVPTDFSEKSFFAYTHAQHLAGKAGAKVDFIHIVPTLTYFNESFGTLGVPFDMESDLYPHIKEETEHKLKKDMDDYLKDENKGDTVVLVDRKPSEAIAEYASKEGYDLIVMASRGEHESELFRGSVTEKVIRYSDVPVYTVDERLKVDALKNILIPTDASPLSFFGLPLALTLAKFYNAKITLYHVVVLYSILSETTENSREEIETLEYYDMVIDELTNFLERRNIKNIEVKRGEKNFEDQLVLTEDGEKTTIPLTTVVGRGITPYYEIESYAPDHSDLVIMTTHGHTGLAHFLLGSTAEKLIQHIKMPVLTVKPPKDQMK